MKALLLLALGLVVISCEQEPHDGLPPLPSPESMILKTGNLDYCTGDLNFDGQVDPDDLDIFIDYYGSYCYGCSSDITGDTRVDNEDFVIFNSQYGKSCDSIAARYGTGIFDPDGFHIIGGTSGAYWNIFLRDSLDGSFASRSLVDSTQWFIDNQLVSTDRDTIRTYFPFATSSSQYVWSPDCFTNNKFLKGIQWIDGNGYAAEKCVLLKYDPHANPWTGVNVTQCVDGDCWTFGGEWKRWLIVD